MSAAAWYHAAEETSDGGNVSVRLKSQAHMRKNMLEPALSDT